MKKIPLILILCFIVFIPLIGQNTGLPDALYSRAERTRYLETSLNQDVRDFVSALKAASPFVTVETFGTSKLGNPLQLVIMAKPSISSPEEALKSGKTVIYVQGNIHSGEVEGKEASMQMMREIAFGTKSYLLDNQIILFCPNYNPDGNDQLGENRPSQEGSPRLTGVRPSGEGYDLNREGMKLEAIEALSLTRNVLIRWDPALLLDLHTDNGSWHGYALNYAPAFHSAGTKSTFDYTIKMLDTVGAMVLDRSGIPMFWHGYLRIREEGPSIFSAYDHHPRYITNSMGLRNRIGILSETFAHDRFEKRVLANFIFLTSLLEYTNDHAKEIRELVTRADEETIQLIKTEAGQLEKGVNYRLTETPDTIPMLIRVTEPYTDERGRRRAKATGQLDWIRNVTHFKEFIPTILRKVPRAYLFPPELENIAVKLRQHGIRVETLPSKTRMTGDEFIILNYNKQGRASYGGHEMVALDGEFRPGKVTFPTGSYYVDMAQPLAWLIFYLLEPESDDGLATWNYFDDYLKNKKVEKGNVPYPVLKIYSAIHPAN